MGAHSGLLNAFERAAQKLATEEQNLHAQLLKSPVIRMSRAKRRQPSWWQSGPCSPWVSTTPGENGLTLYRGVDHRDRVTFHSVVPPDWPGMPEADATNNLAKRQLRRAFIARKLSCGNKTAKGAST